MESVNTTSSSNAGTFFNIIFFIIGLVVIYYLYNYLFGSQIVSSYQLLSKTTSANPPEPIKISSDNLPTLYEGGEFTFSTWIYINNWSYRSGLNKSILNIGGRNTDIIRVYLGGFKPTLMVRFHTKESGIGGTGEDLSYSNQSSTFSQLQTGSDMLGSRVCDLSEIELQRWVNITVAVNGKTVDVYVDGKLSRSCVLPSLFKVDAGGYSANLLEYGGFGGLISTTTMYNSALGPDTVYKSYMAGPEPITSIGQWFYSFFV